MLLKIQSKFNDYYDTASGTGIDQSVLYVRENSHVKIIPNPFEIDNLPVILPNESKLSHYEQKYPQLYTNPIELNPSLSNYQWYKWMDAYQCFQEIQSFISGVLGKAETILPETSNQTKIVKAGFDLKKSFRKPKNK
jgi:hypothetical protein